MKRPRALHPHLPWLCAVKAGAPELEDTATFLVRSSLGAAVPATVASPFWAVPQAQKPEDANMSVTTVRMVVPSTTFAVDTPAWASPAAKAAVKANRVAAKRQKGLSLAVVAPALINTCSVDRGDVLVYSGDLSAAVAADEE